MEPFPGKAAIDPSDNMKLQNYTALKMFQAADRFYSELGLIRVPQSFWSKSMLVKPDDGREVICHATAWDFYDGRDVRIKMCTRNKDCVSKDYPLFKHSQKTDATNILRPFYINQTSHLSLVRQAFKKKCAYFGTSAKLALTPPSP